MRTIQEYLDTAIERNQLQSSNHLAKRLGISSAYVSQLRQRKALPSDELMVEIAKLAGIPVSDALLELRVWNTEGEAQQTYIALIKRLKVTAAAVLLSAISFNSPVLAAPSPSPETGASVYYGNIEIFYIQAI